jgi:NAD(P)-dependent dehydrogenase (short-subunit alcohol dehydrogenase family)
MNNYPYNLEGKRVLVAGAGVGIGLGIAMEAARQGADVVISANSNMAGAHSAVAEMQAMGSRAKAIQANLGQVADCTRLVNEAATFLGGLDGLVYNAGITATIDFMDVTPELFEKLYAINIRGMFFCAQAALPYMLARGRQLQEQMPERKWAGGSIINISSVHSIAGCPGHSVYAGTKGAINAFSRELAVELCPAHIRVNVIAPGTIEVPSYYKIDPNYNSEDGGRMVPWGRVGLPADVGYLANFLLSDAAEFMTGHVLFFDGGLTAKMALPIQPASGER